jgi:hypothetical protein
MGNREGETGNREGEVGIHGDLTGTGGAEDFMDATEYGGEGEEPGADPDDPDNPDFDLGEFLYGPEAKGKSK